MVAFTRTPVSNEKSWAKKRKNEDNVESVAKTPKKPHPIHNEEHTLEYKLDILKEVRESKIPAPNNILAAAIDHDLSENLVKDWMKKEGEITHVLGHYEDTFQIPFEIHTRKSKYELYMMMILNSILNDGFFHANINNYAKMALEVNNEREFIKERKAIKEKEAKREALKISGKTFEIV